MIKHWRERTNSGLPFQMVAIYGLFIYYALKVCKNVRTAVRKAAPTCPPNNNRYGIGFPVLLFLFTSLFFTDRKETVLISLLVVAIKSATFQEENPTEEYLSKRANECRSQPLFTWIGTLLTRGRKSSRGRVVFLDKAHLVIERKVVIYGGKTW